MKRFTNDPLPILLWLTQQGVLSNSAGRDRGQSSVSFADSSFAKGALDVADLLQ